MGATLPGVPVATAFCIEWVLSFGLMLVVMAVATDERVAGGFAGIAVGLTVGFEAMAGGPLTGASMNPARSLGPAVAGGGWAGHWLYWAGARHGHDRRRAAVRLAPAGGRAARHARARGPGADRSRRGGGLIPSTRCTARHDPTRIPPPSAPLSGTRRRPLH